MANYYPVPNNPRRPPGEPDQPIYDSPHTILSYYPDSADNLTSDPLLATVESTPDLIPYIGKAWDAVESGSWAVILFLVIVSQYMKAPITRITKNLEDFLYRLSQLQMDISEQSKQILHTQNSLLDIQKDNTHQINTLITLLTREKDPKN